jgi:hypothetical protein
MTPLELGSDRAPRIQRVDVRPAASRETMMGDGGRTEFK